MKLEFSRLILVKKSPIQKFRENSFDESRIVSHDRKDGDADEDTSRNCRLP